MTDMSPLEGSTVEDAERSKMEDADVDAERSKMEDADVDAEGSAMKGVDVDVNDLKLEYTPQNEDKDAHVTEL